MSGFLAQMREASLARLGEAQAREPLAALRRRAREAPAPPALHLDDRFDLVAELKLRSPALGTLGKDGEDLDSRVVAYARGGAAAVSVLTEPTQFHGSLAQLATAADVLAPLGIPVMRKDFLVDPYQLYEARAAGAGGALLILRMLGDSQLAGMLDCARELGLFTLLECFDADDARRVPPASGDGAAPVLVGVNCRDLQTLKVQPGRFGKLAPALPPGRLWVAESGVANPGDCAAAARLGYRAALVGGALMRAADPAAEVAAMLAAGRGA